MYMMVQKELDGHSVEQLIALRSGLRLEHRIRRGRRTFHYCVWSAHGPKSRPSDWMGHSRVFSRVNSVKVVTPLDTLANGEDN
jgi:hypothetical protein